MGRFSGAVRRIPLKPLVFLAAAALALAAAGRMLFVRSSCPQHPDSDMHGTVRLWNGNRVPIVDPSICAGQQQLSSLPAIRGPAHTLEVTGNATFDKLVGEIDGWMAPQHPGIVALVTAKQWQLGIFGAVGEFAIIEALHASPSPASPAQPASPAASSTCMLA
jgi:hypothetical protein